MNTPYPTNELSNLASKAQSELAQNPQSEAFLSLIMHPDVRRTANYEIAKHTNDLVGKLIMPEEARKMCPGLLYELIKEYDPKKASFPTYLSRYLNFKLKRITRKSRAESAIEDLQNYSKNPALYKAREEIQAPKGDTEASKFIPSTYTLLRQKRLENASFRNPEMRFAEKRKHEIQKDIRQKLLASIKDIKDPVERIFKTSWVYIVIGKEQSSSYITKDDRVKVKPSLLIETATRKARSENIDYSEFDNLSQRGKYARIERYIEQIKKTFREVLADKDVPEWILKLSGTYWTQKLLDQAV